MNQEIEERKQTEPYHCECSNKHIFAIGKNLCHFCKDEISSYSEVSGFATWEGTEIDEVIPICHFCWLKEWYRGEIASEHGYGQYLRKDFLEEWSLNEEEVECLSKYYLYFRRNGWGQSSNKQISINDFLSRWHGTYKCKQELEWLIQTLEKEKKWSSTYDAISYFWWSISDKEGENYWKFSLIKNEHLKQLYQKLEKKDIEQLWNKKGQEEIIPLWDNIVDCQNKLIKLGKCNYCYDNPLIAKFNLYDDSKASDRTDYLCESCIREEMKWYEKKGDYSFGTGSHRYKLLSSWCNSKQKYKEYWEYFEQKQREGEIIKENKENPLKNKGITYEEWKKKFKPIKKNN